MSGKKIPPYVGAKGAYQIEQHLNYTRKKYIREFDHARLPTPASYYSKQFQNFKIKSEWVTVHCCFHDDDIPRA